MATCKKSGWELIGRPAATAGRRLWSVLRWVAVVLALALFRLGPVEARQVDVIVDLYVNEAGETNDVFSDERVTMAFVRAVNWPMIALEAQLGPQDSLLLFVKGQLIPIEPDAFNPDAALELIRAAGQGRGFNYSLDPDSFNEDGLRTRQIIAAMMEDDLAGIGLRRQALGNPVNEVEIFVREAVMRTDLDVIIEAIEYDAAQNRVFMALTIRNLGRGFSPVSQIAIRDAQTGNEVAFTDISGIRPRDSIPAELNLPVPEEWRGTRRRFEVRVDPENSIPETNERNNSAVSDPVVVERLRGPDLAIRRVDARQAPPFDQLEISTTVVNVGTSASPPARLELIDVTTGEVVQDFLVPPLRPDAEHTATFARFIEPEREGRSPPFRAVVDPDQQVEELREDNNDGRSESIAMERPISPDLVIGKVRHQWDVNSGQLRVSVIVENVGGPSMDATTLLLASPAGAFEAVTEPIGALAANSTTSLTFIVTPTPLEDPLTLLLEIDSGAVIDEQDEGNNLRRIQLAFPAQPITWWLIVAIALGAAVIAIVATAVFMKYRAGRTTPAEPERPEVSDTPELSARVRRDPGRQHFDSETSDLVMPGLCLRPKADSGTQRIEWPETEPEKE
jgi:hypothetical protein